MVSGPRFGSPSLDLLLTEVLVIGWTRSLGFPEYVNSEGRVEQEVDR